MMKIYKLLLVATLLTILSFNSFSDNFSISFENNIIAKLRPGQKVTAGYINLTASEDAKIINIESKIIGRIETHSMIMDGEIMKMRKITPTLKKNKIYKFQPGGNHLMLFDIKKELKQGDNIDLLFTFELKNKELLSKSINFTIK
ncbi:MAG: hypothetical protein CMH24_01730 [Nitrosomonadales bacterium]|nr:hypothetical protein [Nitrosomonadales bacterium]